MVTDPDLSLATAKELFLDKSRKTIRELVKVEIPQLRTRSRSMERLSRPTWEDKDDRESQGKRKRAKSDDGVSSSAPAKKVAVSEGFLSSLSVSLDAEEEDKVDAKLAYLLQDEGQNPEALSVTESSVPTKGDNTGEVMDLETSEVEKQVKKAAERESTPPPLSAPEEVEITTPVVNARAQEAESAAKPKTEEAEDARIPKILEISTSFVHPIAFNHLPNEDGSDPCHFCSDFAFGIVGLGRRTVEMVDLGDGRYDELRNGHSQTGHQATRMCSNCVQRRLRVVRCLSHSFSPIQGLSADSFDFKAAYDSLVPGVVGQKRTAKNTWCGLCPTPAFFRCRCGLLLCETCEIMARGFDNDLGKIVAKIEAEAGDLEEGTRADVEFILPGNPLEKQHAQ
ncbi:hypothetical protein BJY00DRAFT_3905 [Aspergillus carlsbadensis]|nr:hypothetical protein BJY00DRAFT_3905 [Aspergillus carlsbadensis]